MDFKKYPSYKHSGVEWLGEVPEHWEQKPIWSMFTRTKRTNHPDELLLSVYRDYGVIPKNSRDDNHNRASEDLTPYQLVKPNDLVINKMKAWQGSIAISEHQGIVSPAYYIYEPKQTYCSKYIHHLIRSVYFIQSYKNFSKGIRVNQWDLEHDAFTHINLLLPPLNEQQQIVSFLDSETSRIDNLIAKQEKLIEKLEEHRNTLTAHTIEKGIKPNTKMINSGGEWLGEVPENWKVGRLKNFAKVNPTIKKFSLDADELVEFIPMSNVDDKKGVIASIDYRKFGEVSTGYTAFNTADVVFAKITPCMENGNCAIIPELKHGFGYGTTEFIVFRPSKAIKTEFLYFLLRSKKLRDICTAFMTGTAGQQRISSEFLANYPIALPNLQEQQEIIDFLQEKNQKIDNLIYKQKALILKLKEYRTSIISHAVTGKIDVRDLVA